MRRVTLLILVSVPLVLVTAGCGTRPDSPTAPTAVTAAAEPETSATADRHTSACSIKSNYGWYKHPTYGTFCYYAELTSVCGQTLYAYNRDLVTNILVTRQGALFAYACHAGVNGRQYRGQWAIGASPGPKQTVTYSSSAYYPPLPRVSDY